jgi:hypothetical protein
MRSFETYSPAKCPLLQDPCSHHDFALQFVEAIAEESDVFVLNGWADSIVAEGNNALT